ncbi:lantibiotic dehydratase [Chitinophaga pendula]|uniref:lantibiotic dehydratase n=1 Tax=Chitinophaga TaxID=79328 RepID=UPI000BAF6D74|nr:MULTISPECIES: lantibiotic dehydratase [Chitinophaga]ASZ09992.1 hypothetical protein CK934_02865 [Chitinophaga sp. MD30]UCJ07064.1 lantibiotic dehydratase [Chitinophaga pendula]
MNVSFFPKLMLRLPTLPFIRDHEQLPEMSALLENSTFLEALRIASANLYEECQRWKAGDIQDIRKIKKLKLTVSKYYNRMRSRATPFGAFSGYSLATWADQTDININEKQRQVRLDMDFLCILVQHIQQDPAIRRCLYYHVNTSLYDLGGEYRYYECYFEELHKKYQVSAITGSVLLEKILDGCSQHQNGLSFTTISTFIRDSGQVEIEEATAFTEELIQHQILVSNLTVQITGRDYLHQIIEALSNVPTSYAPGQTLLKTLQQIHHICSVSTANIFATIDEITTLITATGIPFDHNKLIQVDTRITLHNTSVSQGLQQDIAEAIQVLHILCGKTKQLLWLASFKEQFAERYESRPVPLPQVIDPDTGIPDANGPYHLDYDDPFLNQLNNYNTSIPPMTAPREEHPVKDLLAAKLLQAYKDDTYTVQVTADELGKLKGTESKVPMTDTFPVIFQLIDDEDASLYIEVVGGITGTSLLGRFARTGDETHQLLREIAEYEQQQHPNQVLADVVYLPEDRVGNILLHPVTRQFEIPYLAQSSLPLAQQLPIEDLYLRMENQILQLFSKKLGKQVLPRIDNAHNFQYKTLPLYRLLGAIQGENCTHSLGFSWNATLPGIYFFPRLQYKHIILSAAEWKLPADKWNSLLTTSAAKLPAAFAAFCKEWRLPRYFVLVEGDKTMLVDQEEPITIDTFLAEIKRKETIHLREYLLPAPVVHNAAGQIHAHQFVAIAKVAPTNIAADDIQQALVDTPRDFPPGSEWAYYKLYCNNRKANEILEELILPLANELLATSQIDKWFFIRYNDPQPHLRVRFHLRDEQFTGTLERLLNERLATVFQQHIIWKIQTDTYNRELERYGAQTITETETLFWMDSCYVIKLTDLLQETPQKSLLLMLAALKYADDIMTLCKLPLHQKSEWTQVSQDLFDKEFNTGKEEKEIINQYFRNNSTQLNAWLQPDAYISEYPEIMTLIRWKQRQMKPLLTLIWKHTTSSNKPQLISSLIHMHFNRLFPAGQRRYEMIAYNLLSKYYKSQIARQMSYK